MDADLLSELSQVINLLAEYDVDDNATNYVLIDRLDENWISNSTKIHLVRALVEALKGLRRIGDLKVVVSLRSDLMERVIVETKDLGFQGEKYEDYVLRLRWDADQLRRLINSRINLLYRRKYKSENIQFEQVFVDKIGKGSTFSFLVERTLHRPRDMISFVNNCLEHAAGKSEVRRSDVHSAERVYSEGRRVALVDEWRPIFPGVEPLLRLFERRRAYFPLSELHTADTAVSSSRVGARA